MPFTGALPDPLRKLLPAQLLALASQLDLRRGDWLFRQRQHPKNMFYVDTGEVLLQRDGMQGDKVVLQRVRQGFVAEASLQSHCYHCDGLAAAAGTVVSVPIAPLQACLAHDPAFALRWIVMLNVEVRRLRAQCERMSLRGVRARLLHMIEAEGTNGRLAVRSDLKSLAAELAVTHEALYRCLAALEKDGAVVREPGAIRRLQAIHGGALPAAAAT